MINIADPKYNRIYEESGKIISTVIHQTSFAESDLLELFSLVVDGFDKRIRSASGPSSAGWRDLGDLENMLSNAYFQCVDVTTLMHDISAITFLEELKLFDVNQIIEISIRLFRHQYPDMNVSVDLGSSRMINTNRCILILCLIKTLTYAIALKAKSFQIKTNNNQDTPVIVIEISNIQKTIDHSSDEIDFVESMLSYANLKFSYTVKNETLCMLFETV